MTTSRRASVRIHVESPKGMQEILAHHHTGDQGSSSQARLTAILRHEGLPLNTRCGERSLCDGCMVELVQGSLERIADGQPVTVAQGAAPVSVRGCEYRVAPHQTDVFLRMPARSLLAHEPQVVSEFKVNVPYAHDPLLPVGTDPLRRRVGVAVDIGTTTVALMLVDLATGQILGRAAGFNRQMHLGDDVVTRINLCSTDPTMLAKLQQAVVQQTIAPLVKEALQSVADLISNGQGKTQVIDPACLDIAGFVMAGNTTMLHILAGVDPSSLGVSPFTAAFLDHRQLTAGSIGLSVPHGASAHGEDIPVHLLPGAAAYVGADLVAGIFSSGLIYDQGPCLLVDVGTNGEIVLKHKDRMLGCATAAGPAFEGARLASGIRAGRGAISTIHIADDWIEVDAKVIGDEQAIGMCGSAYIDFLAQARRVNLINTSGRFEPNDSPGAKLHLVEQDGHTNAFRVAWGKGKQPIVVTETDIASLLQAKAAIAAGILTLLQQAGLKPEEVKTLYLAGGFGTHMNHAHAIGCGLLPGFKPEQVQVVGNSSLAGAFLSLIDEAVLHEMNRIARSVEIVELNLVPEFEDSYIDQLSLP